MKRELAECLVIVSRLLDYPQAGLFAEWPELEFHLAHSVPAKLASGLRDGTNRLLKRQDLPEIYVQTFDFNEKTCLYLTAHEFGESRKRGAALIELQQLVREFGFEAAGNELADYIPLLLELLAAAPSGEKKEWLKKRLSYAIYRIIDHLPKENPYYFLFEWMTKFAFKAPDKNEKEYLERLWEGPDLDPLPYPLFYQ